MGSTCKDISHIQYVTAWAAELTLCTVAGPGIELGTGFGFAVGETTVVASSGPPPIGSCASAGRFPAGMQVAVRETIPADVIVGAITCAGVATCSSVDLAAGTVIVGIGIGSNEVIYTNERPDMGSPELCADRIDNDRDGIVDEGCIVGRAWFDRGLRGNIGIGVQEPVEPGIESVVFQLFTSDGTLVASTLSGANGIYSFSNVPAGTYFVRAIGPFPNLGATQIDCRAALIYCDDTLDSDFDGANGLYNSALLAFPADGSIGHLDIGFFTLPD